MRENYEMAFALTLKYEGGYVNHPSDPGGATNLGITIGTLSSHLGRKASIADVKALTPAKVKPIYKKRYWDKVEGDRLPAGLDLLVWDFAVNSGPARAAKALQKIAGVPQDGVIGDDTIEALKGKNVAVLIQKYTDQREKFLRGLSTFRTFGKGWMRRVEGMNQTAMSWHQEMDGPYETATANTATPMQPVGIMAVPDGGAKADPQNESAIKAPEVQSGVATAIGTIGATASEAAQQIAPLSYSVSVLKYVFIALTLVGICAGMYVAMKRVRSPD